MKESQKCYLLFTIWLVGSICVPGWTSWWVRLGMFAIALAWLLAYHRESRREKAERDEAPTP